MNKPYEPNLSFNSVVQRSFQKSLLLTRRQAFLARKILSLSHRLSRYQWIRLVTGGVGFLGLTASLKLPGWFLEWIVIFILAPLFCLLLISTRRMSRHLKNLEELKLFFARQQRRCTGSPSGQEGEKIKTKLIINLPKDLGLLGNHSLWTTLNETLTDEGEKKLLAWMNSSETSFTTVKNRQRLLRDLRTEHWFFTKLTLLNQRENFQLSTRQISDFLNKPLLPSHFNKLLLLLWVVWTLALFALLIEPLRSGASFFGVAFILLNLLSLQRVSEIFLKTVGLIHHLSELAPLLSTIEKRAQKKPVLASLFQNLLKFNPTRSLKNLELTLGFLGTQTNPLLHLLVNAAAPWTLTAYFFLERQRKSLATHFSSCVTELAEFEALGSLIIFYEYQTQVFPTFSDESQDKNMSLSFTGLFHPLIDRSKVVANDFTFSHGKNLGLLTGSNMSGKSTFLRTLGVNQILAQMGAPVFAEAFHTRIYRIETCIEVTDSLRDGFSYFYAEVLKLKHILEEIALQSPVLYLIDEIFRGTNNRERQIGSRAVLERLSQSPKALGFVSTHDLELTPLESTNPSIINLHFREWIDEAGEMKFSYRLQAGPCPTTNALRIMQKEGILLL